MQKTQEGYIVADHEHILGVTAPGTVYANGLDDRWAKAFHQWGLQVTGIGDVPTAWEVVVEISLDGGANFTEVLNHNETSASSGDIIFVEHKPGVLYRVVVNNLTLNEATAIDIGFVAM